MNVATFDAWPPGQHETRIRPVARGAESFRVWESDIDVSSYDGQYTSKHNRINCKLQILGSNYKER